MKSLYQKRSVRISTGTVVCDGEASQWVAFLMSFQSSMMNSTQIPRILLDYTSN